MDQVIELAGYSASEATKILTQATSDLVDFGKESLWAYYEGGTADGNGETIEKDLNSNYEREKLSALKRLLVMMGRGQDCRSYFAAVIKNVAFNSFAVKKLVYIYLLRYAEQEPDLALLSVNSFQKDLSDPNPMVRSVALRVLCSIRVPMLSSVMMAACKKGASDMSPFVRKAVAVSLVKTFKLDPLQKEGLIELIHQLINNEKSHIVMGSVLYSMDQICPERYNLIHKHFKRVCKLLVESDEWSQIQIIQVLARYCRIHFTDPSHCSSASLTRADESQNGIAKEPSPPPLETISPFPQLDPDYQLFIDSCKALLASRNPMLIVLASQISYDLAPGHPMRILAAKSLIRSLSRPKQEQHMILVAIKSLIIRDAKPWVGFITAFAVYPTEIEEIKALKLDILVLLASEDSMNWIVPELKNYSSCHDSFLALYAIKSWRIIVTKIPSIVQSTLESLISLLSHPNDAIVGESIITIRLLLSTQPPATPVTIDGRNGHQEHHEKLLSYLVSMYDHITVAQARASILWLIGRNLSLPLFKHGPDLLRISLQSFRNADQDPSVKLQILVLSTLLRLHVDISPLLYDEKTTLFIKEANDVVFKLARLDADFDVRDFGRFLEGSLLSVWTESGKESPSSSSLHRRFFDLLSHFRPVSKINPPKVSSYPIGTLSHLVGSMQPGFTHLPNWSTSIQCSEERAVVVDEQEYRAPERSAHQTQYQQSQSFVKPIKTKRMAPPVNLDDFYGESTTSSSNFDDSEKMTSDQLWALDSEDSDASRSSRDASE